MSGRPRLAAALALALALPAAAGAETAQVRSGEHSGFTRLVIKLAHPADWRLGRVEGGYGLELARPGVEFDLSRVYRLISRARVAALSQEPGLPRLTLELGCDCHATAMDFSESWIVVDVRDGPAPASSPFEVALAPVPAQGDAPEAAPSDARTVAAGATSDPPDVAAASTLPRLLPSPGSAGPGAFIAARGPADAGAGREASAEAGGGSSDDPALASRPEAAERAAAAGGWPLGPAMPHVPAPVLAPVPPGGVAAAANAVEPEIAAWESEWRRPLHAAPIADGLAVVPGAESAPHFGPAAERIAAQEAALLEELARAAAQGLLQANLPALDRLRQNQAEIAGAATADAAPPAAPEPPAPEAHVRLEAQTSMDRDTGASAGRRPVTDEGLACLPDAAFDVAAWGNGEDPAEGITARRRGLVGEFDRPDAEAVLALARYYLHLGFGAEAKATLAAFETGRPEEEVLGLIAAIVDGDRVGLPGVLAGQGSCPGPAALWSLLAEGGPHPGDAPNQRAVVAAFSALPLTLRRPLGPELAARFLALGDRETAIRLRNAVARAPGEHGGALELLDARLALAEGDPGAPAALAALAAADDGVAAEAYRAFLETELAAGRVPPESAETAAAFAFEITGTETGTALAGLSVQGLLAGGDFEAARREILRLETAGTLDDPRLWSDFAHGLARGAQDGEFLRQAFAARDRLAGASLPASVATALARRLTDLGFPEEALRYLPVDGLDEPALFARAEALIGSGAPAEAFGALAALRGAEADHLRGRALLALGDPHGAAERFAAAGDPASAEHAAWIAGAWDLLAASEDATLRRLADARRAARPGEALAAASVSHAGAAGAGAPPPEAAAATAAEAEAQPADRVAAARAALAAAAAAREAADGLLARAHGQADPS